MGLKIDYLVVGASGQVGTALLHTLEEKKQEYVGTSSSVCNLADLSSIKNLAQRYSPRILLVPASLTKVDECQNNPDLSYQINVEGIKLLLSSFKDSKFVYFSSDYIFDGKKGPYSEKDAPNPIQVYGLHKLIAERLITTYTNNYAIIRTNMVYGPDAQKKNYTSSLYRTLSAGQVFRSPHDEYVTPTFNLDLAREAIDIAHYSQGTFHIAGEEVLSRYEFSVKFAERYNLRTDLICPVTNADLGRPAPRPLRGGLRSNLPGFSQVLEGGRLDVLE